jgi:hypothetical protein
VKIKPIKDLTSTYISSTFLQTDLRFIKTRKLIILPGNLKNYTL